MYDVLVAGAGPAGTATAIHLVRAGRSVVLVDRATFPRRKACGEGLFPAGVDELGELGVLPALRAEGHALEGVRFLCGGESATGTFGDGEQGLGIRRDILDTTLVEAARSAGVAVVEATSVRSIDYRRRGSVSVNTSRGSTEARMVVAADGVHSQLRRAAGLNKATRARRYGISAHVRVPATGRLVDVRLLGNGELYTTPVGPGQLNVAVLGTRRVVGSLARHGSQGYTELMRRELGDVEIVDSPLVRGPFPSRCAAMSRGRLVLTGDAAGFFDGITGEGMSIALRGAPICAVAVDEALRTNSRRPLHAYEREMRRLSRNSTILGRVMLLLAERQPIARFAVGRMGDRPRTFNKLIAINSGTAGFGTLRPADASVVWPW